MTKVMIVKWLQGKQADALCAIENQYREQKKLHDEALFVALNCPVLAAEIQPLFNEIEEKVRTWQKTANSVEGVLAGQGWNSTVHKISDFTRDLNGCAKYIRQNDYDDKTPEQMNLIKQRDTLKSEIKKNYESVIRNIQKLKDAKAGIEYLDKLGFDLSDLKAADVKPVETALAVKVDTRFLFLADQLKGADLNHGE